MLCMVSHPHRPQSGHITCYLNRTYHVLPTGRSSFVAGEQVWVYRELVRFLQTMYRVAMPNRLRYTLVAVLFSAAVGSVLLAARPRSFHWYTWAALVVFLIGTGPLLWEK